jgi:uncharacterized membrane protein
MAKVQKKVIINAPIDKVFVFMADPRNLPEIWPSMVDVKNVRPGSHGGFNFDWVYKMGGLRFDGASDCTEYTADKHLVTQSTKGIESKFVWDYETVMDGTQLILSIEYRVPVPLIGKLAESILINQNDREADLLLENLKNKMEAHTSVLA